MTHGKETQRGNRVARARATQPNARTPLSLTHAPTDCAIVTISAVLPRALHTPPSSHEAPE
eukprot:2512152-Prymnesium_polylepis.1